MRALVQRVARASVTVQEDTERIDRGLVVFIGVGQDDDEEDARYIVDKVVNLRIFEDEAERFDHSALDVSANLWLSASSPSTATSARDAGPRSAALPLLRLRDRFSSAQ